jgi:hypothetical protein
LASKTSKSKLTNLFHTSILSLVVNFIEGFLMTLISLDNDNNSLSHCFTVAFNVFLQVLSVDFILKALNA